MRQVLVSGVERPNLWVDVSATLQRGLQALRCHESQIDDWDEAEARVRERAAEVGGAGGHAHGPGLPLDPADVMRGRGMGRGMWGGAEPDLTARPGSGPRTLRQIAEFFRPYRGRLLGIAVLILVSVSIGVINPILLKLVIDNLLGPKDLQLLYLQCGLMIVLPFISSGLGVWQSYLSNVVGQRVMDDLRLALYTHLQWMPLRFFTETRTGEIQSRIGNDVNGVQTVVTDTAASLLSNFATVATTVIAMLILDWRLTILSLGMLPIFAYITFRVGKVRREVSGATQRSLAEVSAITEESLSVSGILLSKTFGQQRASIEKFRKESRRLGDLQIRQQMIGRWFFAMIGIFFSIAPAFVYLLAGTLIIEGDPGVSVGTIVAFTTLQSRLFFPLGQLLNVQVEIQGALALFDRIFEYLEMPHEITDAPDAVALDPVAMRGDVRFRDVSFRYPPTAVQLAAEGEAEAAEASGRAVKLPIQPFGLHDIDFEARPGQLVALVGPSGSGKTTTTYLIPRLYDVAAGAVEIDGNDVRRTQLESLGRVIGVVTQETYLFHSSVLDNLRYAKPEASLRRWRRPPARRRSMTACWSCRRDTTRSSASAATSCPAARSSVSPSLASCSRTPAS